MSNKDKANILDVIKYISPEVYNYALILYNDIEHRPDPQKGDIYEYGEKHIVFENVMLDSDFNHGVAFNYIFHLETDENKKIIIRSINSITDDNYILNTDDIRDMYGFWKYTYPINNDNKK